MSTNQVTADQKNNLKELKREAFNLKTAVTAATGAVAQISTPEKIQEDILREFKNRARPIMLITPEQRAMSSKVIHFDREFLYVRIARDFECNIGSLIIVEFRTETEAYVVQTFVYKYTVPILCLKFQDPRRDPRLTPKKLTPVQYVRIEEDEELFKEDNIFIVRTIEQPADNARSFAVRDKIGRLAGVDQKGKKIIREDENITFDKTKVKEGSLKDFSLGGCCFNAPDETIPANSLLFVMFEVDDILLNVGRLEISLYATVRAIMFTDPKNIRYGVSFMKRVVHDLIT